MQVLDMQQQGYDMQQISAAGIKPWPLQLWLSVNQWYSTPKCVSYQLLIHHPGKLGVNENMLGQC